MKQRLQVFLLILAGVILATVFLFRNEFGHVITPEEMTYTAIDETFYRIDLYMKKNDAIPKSLSVLPKRDGYANSVVDGWGNQLRYSVTEDGVLMLTSFGRDGESGGTGNDRDISKSYRTRNEYGKEIIDDPLWIVNGEVQE